MTRRRNAFALLVAAVVLVTASGCGIFGGPDKKRFSADFDRAIGVYVHSDVRVLGVRVGEITKITPRGNRVRIEMTYDSSYKIPHDAKAVLLAPSIVSDRYVQLTPAYTSGATLPDGTHLGLDRTTQPVELDDIYANLDSLNQSLGPNGANKKGALADLLDVGAQNLGGNGRQLNSTLTGLSQAVKTLSDSRNDLFGTISNLQTFTSTIARNDALIRTFNADLAEVSAQLAAERVDLALAIKQLAVALGEVASFVKQNKDNLTYNVTNLAEVTKVLVNQKAALREFLDTAPTALSNLQLAYNAGSGTLDTRDNSGSQGGPAGILCNLLAAAGRSPTACMEMLSVIPSQPPAAAPAAPKLPKLAPLSLGALLVPAP